MTERHIVAMGGGQDVGDPVFRYASDLVDRPRPKVCLVPTAASAVPISVMRFLSVFPADRFEPTYLDLFNRDDRDLRDFVCSQDLIFVGGGAGLAPILALLRSMAERGLDRKATFFYGARTRKDLCFEAELHALEEQLPNFKYVPALSEPGDDDGWDGETGLITDVVKRLASDLRGAHAYVCGPPPMVEAALPLLETLGVEEKRIYYDKFTTTGNPQE